MTVVDPPRPHDEIPRPLPPLTWAERWRVLRADPRTTTAVLLAVVVLAGSAWWYLGRTPPRADDPGPARTQSAGSSTTVAPADATPTTAISTSVFVHVAGAVAQPGVIELAASARVVDAIAAAGGAVVDADLNRVNLAAKLRDGQRIHIPRVGEVVEPILGEASALGDGADDGGTETGGLINLNTATARQLEELPGIGPTLAAAIVDERTSSGGFKRVDDLRNVRGIGEKRFAELRDQVTV